MLARQTAMNSHASTSSLNGQEKLYVDGEETRESPAFPSLTPLSHDLTLLSPIHTPTFSVDDFLVSRTKASDLNFILSDLRSYSEKLKDELYSIINEDYKDFVSLGSSLKSEAHRIARLGWNTRPTYSDIHDHAPTHGLMAPVRDTLLASRSMLKSVQDDIEDCIKRKEDATSHKAKLELMLQLHDSIVRLEDLLLIHNDARGSTRRRSSHAARRPSLLSVTSIGKRRDSVASVASGSDQEVSDYAMSSEYEEDTESGDESSDELGANEAHHHGQHRRSQRRILHRLSSDAHVHQTRSALHTRGSDDHPGSRTQTRSDTLIGGGAASSSSSLLGLPQRIARTSAEYSRLRFLHRRINEEKLTHFTDALQDRLDKIRSVLRNDVRTLVAHLVSPTSLLVHGQSKPKTASWPELRKSHASPTARRTSFLQNMNARSQALTIHEQATNELDAWTQVAEPAEQGGDVEAAYWSARFEEQRSWLEMALSTLNTLTLVREADGADATVKRSNEAEEAVRDLLVDKWADKNMTLDKESQRTDVSIQNSLETLPRAVQTQFEEHHNHVGSLLVSSSSPNRLVELYNSVLAFVAIDAWQVCDASREISDQTHPISVEAVDSTQDNHELACDIFTNVVWDTLSTRLLDSMGSTIFFVGHTDTFYSNFTLTNTLLERLLSLAPTDKARLRVQQHANWTAFKRRWQLPVYFQMRFRQVVTELEAELADGRVGGDQGCMRATHATVQAIRTVWSAGVHIHELSAREWRVTLQILSRYKTWVEEEAPVEMRARKLDGMRTSEARTSSELRASASASADVSRVSTPQPVDGVQERDDQQLLVGVALVRDGLFLKQSIEVMLDETILPCIAAHGVDQMDRGWSTLRSDLLAVLDESLDFIPALISSIGRLLHNVMLPRVVSPLRMLRSFSTPAYRTETSASANPGPSIQVIHQMMQPLQTFVSSNHLANHIKREWSLPILADAFKRYISTIETINKNQHSLIRLKNSHPPPALLAGLFQAPPKQSTAPGLAELEKSFTESNRHALATWSSLIHHLQLDIDLDSWSDWLTLKNFLLSSPEQM